MIKLRSLLAAPVGSEGLGCIFDDRNAMLFRDGRERVHIGTLSVKMNGHHGAHELRVTHDFFDGCWIEVEGRGINVGEDWYGSAAGD